MSNCMAPSTSLRGVRTVDFDAAAEAGELGKIYSRAYAEVQRIEAKKAKREGDRHREREHLRKGGKKGVGKQYWHH